LVREELETKGRIGRYPTSEERGKAETREEITSQPQEGRPTQAWGCGLERTRAEAEAGIERKEMKIFSFAWNCRMALYVNLHQQAPMRKFAKRGGTANYILYSTSRTQPLEELEISTNGTSNGAHS
jgi:hypothetical protein